MAIDYKRIHEIGWLQGSVFSIANSTELIPSAHWHPLPERQELPAQTRLVVVSHSCDIVSPNPMEQYIEVCPAAPLPDKEALGQFGYARDPRRLRLPMNVEGRPVLHELWAPLRFVIGRAVLEQCAPDRAASLSDEDFDHFTFWLSARVRRRSFPNALDQRIGTDSHKRIRKALSRVEDDVEALLYSISTERELKDGEAYRMRVVLLAKPEAVANAGKLDTLETVRDKIAEILSDKPGVEVEVVDLASSARMSVATAAVYKNWGFEDLSLEADAEP
jgi:hypothetical protein